MKKLSKYITITAYTILLSIITYLLIVSGILYFKYNDLSITIGLNFDIEARSHAEDKSISTAIKEAKEQLFRSKKEMRDTDAIIEDARRRGIL